MLFLKFLITPVYFSIIKMSTIYVSKSIKKVSFICMCVAYLCKPFYTHTVNHLNTRFNTCISITLHPIKDTVTHIHVQVFLSIKYMTIFWLKSAILFPGLWSSEGKSVCGSLLYIPRNQNPQVRGNWWVSGKCIIIHKRYFCYWLSIEICWVIKENRRRGMTLH